MAGDDTDSTGESAATNSAYASRQTDSKNRSDSGGGGSDGDSPGDDADHGANATLSSAVGGGRAGEEYEDLEPDDDSGDVADDDEIEEAAAELQDRLGELDVEGGADPDAEDGDKESEPLENVSDLPDFEEFEFDGDADTSDDEASDSEDDSGDAEPAGASGGTAGAVAGAASVAGSGTPTGASATDSDDADVEEDSGEGPGAGSGLEDDGGSESGEGGSEASSSDGSAGSERDGAATGIEPGGDVEEPSTPGEFAATALDESVIDDRYLSEDGTIDPSVDPPCVPTEAPGDTTQMGGFPEYDPDAIENREPIVAQADEGHGFSAAAIESGEVVDDARDEVGTHTIYATNYAPDPGSGAAAHTVDDRELAVAQLSSTVFVQSLGAEVDRMTYDAEANQIVAETVEPDPDTDATEVIDLDNNDDRLDDVDEEEIRDKVAIQLLSGNWDMPPRNVQLSEDGAVHIHDRDRAYKEFRHNPYDEIETSARNAEETVDMINNKAPQSADEIDIDSEDFAERALVIAHELETSGYADQATENVEQVMEKMAETPHFDESLCQAHERLRENIRKAAVAAENTGFVRERELTSSQSMPGS